MNEELISIIIPIYNVEKYLDKCIKSIEKQTYQNIEIILVDDGSPDNCGEMCDKYAQADKRIKVIHKKNGGLSDARNEGVKISTGKYITFIDSDDYVEEQYIELLYKAIIQNNTEISQCGINEVNEEEKLINEIGEKEDKVKSTLKMLEELYYGKWENTVVWNKMYKRSLFNDIKFPINKIHEDEFTTYKILYKIKKVSIIKERLYNYRKNSESITGKKFNSRRLDFLIAIEERLEFFQKNKEVKLYNLTLKCYLENIRYFYMCVKKYMKNEKETNEILKKLKNKYRITYKKIIKIKMFKRIYKIKTGFFYITPNLYYLIKKGKL